MDIANSIDWMLPNCPEACADLGDVAGLPLDPYDDKYEKLSNDVIEDEVGGCSQDMFLWKGPTSVDMINCIYNL